ncbi:MAG: TlpA disulfide reductase family protein [Planctomycetaceae bacterium]
MWKRSSVHFLLLVCILGCDKSEPSRDAAQVDAVATEPGINDSPISPAEPSLPAGASSAPESSSPPGKIELPKDFDASAVPADTPADGGKAGGIEMPAVDSDTPAPVIAQRPVLDDGQATAPVKLTAQPLQATLERATKAGKVCVVDVWSLSCEPCLKEFPGLVRLSQELGSNVVCMSVNVDYDGRKSKPAESYRSKVEAFLRATGATFDNYLCETPSEEVFASLKVPSIPVVLVYDQDGKLVRTFADSGDDVGFNYADDIAPLVRSLVAP